MGTKISFATLVLIATVALPWSTQLQAEPEDCNPKVAMAPSESESQGSNFFSRLFGDGDKPQAFSGAVMDDPDPGCQLAIQVRSVTSELRPRDRNRVQN